MIWAKTVTGSLFLLGASVLQGSAQSAAPLPNFEQPQTSTTIETSIEMNIGQLNDCARKTFARPIEIEKTNNGLSFIIPGAGRGAARFGECYDGKLVFEDIVMLDDVIRKDQVAGSAIKADRLTLWAPLRRQGCDIPVDYGMEMMSFRWFNWDERIKDGGNTRLEVIRDQSGQEKRVSTISHLRAQEVIWTPKPADAASACAVTGQYQVNDIDVRWSTGGNAYGMKANTAIGKGSLPLLPDDAEKTFKKIGSELILTAVEIEDITETTILSAPKIDVSVQLEPQSAVVWSHLIKKYTKELMFRKNDVSLLSYVWPLDLSNTLHFTRGVVRISMPQATAQTSAVLPVTESIDLAKVHLSSVILHAESAILLRGEETNELRLNLGVEGVGIMKSIFGFRTQMFNRDMLDASSKKEIDLRGKTGPGLTSFTISLKDQGISQAFIDIFNSSAGSYLVKNVNDNMEFWNGVAGWFRMVEKGEEKPIMVRFPRPQLLGPDFWKTAFDGASIKVGG